MTTFTYKMITPDRAIVEGEATALFGALLKWRLSRQKNIVLFVQRGIKTAGVSSTKRPWYLSITSIEQILLYRNLAMMLDSGITLGDALNNLIWQARGFGVKTVLENIYFEVSNGTPLSRAIGRYPKLAPEHVAKTIEVGEQSGTLSQTLDRISQDFERSYELRRKVVSAISYPLIIFCFMIVTAILLIVMVLPQITKLFVDLNAELPFATRVLQSVGIFLSTYPLQIIGVLLAVIVAFTLALKNFWFRLTVHAALLRLPIFGTLIREYSLSVFTRALGTLLASGVTFVQAIETVKGTLRNESYRQKIEQIQPLVLQGSAFSDAMRISSFHFPDQFRCLIEVGEKTGQLRKSFEKASQHYERSVIFQTQMLTTVLEPILMLIAGVLVGFLAFSIFGPIYDIVGHM